jgi:uncharacterized membrane protein HdeD (DUF308 family)
MRSQLYGAVGLALGVLTFIWGIRLCLTPSQGVLGLALLLCGALVFGCGLVAAAVAATKSAKK